MTSVTANLILSEEHLQSVDAHFGHETLFGRAVLPHSLNIKAAQQRRPTKVATRIKVKNKLKIRFFI